MDNLEKIYTKLLKRLGNITPRPWQKKALLNESIWNDTKTVLAAGTGGGKTFFTILWLCMRYLRPSYKNKITLILPSAQLNLRDNFGDNLKKFGKTTFTYFVAKSGKEITQAIDEGYQVIIALPQSLSRVKDLPKIDTLIVDEAHTWYFAKTIKEIVKKTKPEQRLLLTGTPAPFNLRGGFNMYYVPVMDLYDEGSISNTQIQILASKHNFKESDFNVNNELTLKARNISELESEASFRTVCFQMYKKLKNPMKGFKNVNRLTNEAGGLLFNHLDKTIIWAADIKQANKFARILREFKGLENAVLVSHSKNDRHSNHLNDFKNQDWIKVLVCVDRTRLGWDYTELFHGIDFTMSRNLNTIQQMMARLFRISEKNPKKQKYFYKVSNSKDAGYYTSIMKGVLLLLDREWMSKFNGKNFSGMQIPVTIPNKERRIPKGEKQPNPGLGRPRTNYQFEMLETETLDLNFFRTVFAKQDDPLSCIAWATLGDARRKIYKLKTFAVRTKESVIKEAKTFNSYTEYYRVHASTIEWARDPNNNCLQDIYDVFGHIPKNAEGNKIRVIKYMENAKKYKPTEYSQYIKDLPYERAFLAKHADEKLFSYFTYERGRNGMSRRIKATELETGKTIIYATMAEAVNQAPIKLGECMMRLICKGKKDSYKGYKFEYIK